VFWDQEIVVTLVPKNASSSLRQYFQFLQSQGVKCERVREVALWKVSRLSSFTWWAIARAPRSRLVSAFNNKNGQPAFVNVPGLDGQENPVAFYNFIAGAPNFDSHWRPQTKLVLLPLKTSWIRMDGNSDVVDCVSQLLGTPAPLGPGIFRKNVTSGMAPVEMSQESEQALERLLSTIYRDDCELWEKASDCKGIQKVGEG